MEGVTVNKGKLRFMIPVGGVATSDSVRVTNDSDVAITFKMKTTTDKAGFIVQPKTGIVKAGATREIIITYKRDIDENPRLRLDVVPFNTPYELTAAQFWTRREDVLKHGNKESKKIALASLPLYKYPLSVELVEFDEHYALNEEEYADGDRPRAGLVFNPHGGTDSIEVENHSEDPVTFRVRSTDDAIFSVQPSHGVIDGNGCTEVFCYYNGGRRDGRRRHFFQVEIANQYVDNPAQFWKDYDMERVELEGDLLKHKFKVQFDGGDHDDNNNNADHNRGFTRRASTAARGLSFRSKKGNGACNKYNNTNRNNNTKGEADEAMYANARSSLPNGAKNPASAYRKKQRPTSTRGFSRVWGSLRRQPTFLSSRSNSQKT